MKTKVVIASTLSVLCAGNAIAADPPKPEARAAVAKKASGGEQVRCRTEETLGSRLGSHRVCHTVREWEQMQLENRLDMDKRQATLGPPQ